jgi:hypothetical protein
LRNEIEEKRNNETREKTVRMNCEAKSMAQEVLEVARNNPSKDAWKKLILERLKAAFRVIVLKYNTKGKIKMPTLKLGFVTSLEPEIDRLRLTRGNVGEAEIEDIYEEDQDPESNDHEEENI